MTPPGTKPKPREVRIREGKPGHRPLPVPVRLATILHADPPARLTEREREAWHLIADPLAENRILQRQYLPLVEAMAVAIVAMWDAAEGLRREPQVIEDKQGRVVNPWLRAYRDNVRLVLSLAEHLGASPISMARLGLATIRGKTLQEELAERYRADHA